METDQRKASTEGDGKPLDLLNGFGGTEGFRSRINGKREIPIESAPDKPSSLISTFSAGALPIGISRYSPTEVQFHKHCAVFSRVIVTKASLLICDSIEVNSVSVHIQSTLEFAVCL